MDLLDAAITFIVVSMRMERQAWAMTAREGGWHVTSG
jgi:hypothetical protein